LWHGVVTSQALFRFNATVLKGARWALPLLLIPAACAAPRAQPVASDAPVSPADAGAPKPYRGRTAAELLQSCRLGHDDDCLSAFRDGVWRASESLPPVAWREDFGRACAAGASSACAVLGYLFEMGLGVAQDTRESKGWYRKACDGQQPWGCARLGVLLDRNLDAGVDDAREAFRAFQTGCTKNDGASCAALARVYEAGERRLTDSAAAGALNRKALELQQAACEGLDTGACAAVASAYQWPPVGVARDAVLAARYAAPACDWGNLNSCYLLAALTGRGEGVPKDERRAFQLLRDACRAGHEASCAYLLRALRESNGKAVPADEVVGFLRHRCDLGTAQDCYTLAELIVEKHAPGYELGQARVYLDKACAMGLDAGACAR
jgi:TPR repeat protein